MVDLEAHRRFLAMKKDDDLSNVHVWIELHAHGRMRPAILTHRPAFVIRFCPMDFLSDRCSNQRDVRNSESIPLTCGVLPKQYLQ